MTVSDGGFFPRRVAKRYIPRLNQLEQEGYISQPSFQVRHFGLFGFHCYFEDKLIEPVSAIPTYKK